MLGAARIERPAAAPHVLERKDAALLTLLALDGPTAAARAAALLWPDTAAQQARNNLRQRLFRLRRAAGSVVVATGPMLKLAQAPWVDIVRLDDLLTADAGAATGDLLGGLDYSDTEGLEQWVQAARARCHATRLNILARRASELEAQHEIAAALVYAQRMLAHDPLLEHAHRRLMRLHYLRGDRAAALAAFQRCREALHVELGTQPDGETMQLAALIESSHPLPQPAPPARAPATLRPPRLVGRDSEWQRLESARRAGHAALVIGEPGVGKTRLLADFTAARGTVPPVGARPGDARLPYALLARLVRGLLATLGPPGTAWAVSELARVVPELGPATPGPLLPLRLRQALHQALAEGLAAGLALVALDDLHHADEATLDLLLPLIAAAHAGGPAWLLAVRAAEMPPALAAWADATAADGQLDRLPLEPLPLPAVQQLLESLAVPGLDAAQWAAALTRHTGGNPMFLLETLIAMLGEGAGRWPVRDGPPVLPGWPASTRIGALIEQRLQRLSPGALKLARTAALAGSDFSAELAAAVLGRHVLDIADDWRELEAAQVIRDDAFAHDLILEGTLRSIPAPIAGAMHRDLAEALRQRRAPPARVAAHWAEAGEWAQAALAFREAAGAAFAAARPADEVQLWQRAIDCHERAGDRAGAFRARHASFEAVMAAQPLEQADALAERLAGDARDDSETLDARLAQAWVALGAGDASRAHDLATQAQALARLLARPANEFDATRTQALALAQLRRAAEGAAALEPLGTWVEAHGNATQQHRYWSDLAYVLNLANRRREAAKAWTRAIETARLLGDQQEEATCTTNLTGIAGQLGQPAQALQYAERAQRLQARLGEAQGIGAGAVDMNLALFEALHGRFDRALALFEAVLERFRGGSATSWQAACEHNFAVTWLQLGQTARAGRQLTPVSERALLSTRARRLVVEGRIGRALGRSALPRLREAMALLGERGDPYTRMVAELDESRELEPDLAARQCLRVADEADALEHFAAGMRARVLAVEAMLRGADPPAALPLAQEVRARLPDCAAGDFYAPEAMWIVQQALAAGGDPAGAAALLVQARAWVTRTALPHVPPSFRESFLQRNPVNRALLINAPEVP
ncbi:MAG: AAA family ATPase [Rubrivivax sp.]|nr:AAA family ATPase [Rubrivivax sp.]